MSFGRRITASTDGVSSGRVAEQPRTRKGGYWLGLLANAGAAAVTMAALPLISQFKLNGATFSTLIVPAIIALANLIVVAAVITLLVDLALRGLNWRRPWIYALTCALTVFCFYMLLALVVGAIDPIFAMYLAVWPAAVGGWVLGLYRR